MKRDKLPVIFLSVALVASNLWWLYGAIDSGITASYRQDSLERCQDSVTQALAIVPLAIDTDATRERILAAAAEAAGGNASFEKEGFVWMGALGYRFDASGHLIELRALWDL